MKNVLFFSGSVMTGPFTWKCRKLLLPHSYKYKRGVKYFFKKTPYFLILLQFTKLLVEDFGFIASSLYLGIDEGKVLGHLVMLWRLFFLTVQATLSV